MSAKARLESGLLAGTCWAIGAAVAQLGWRTWLGPAGLAAASAAVGSLELPLLLLPAAETLPAGSRRQRLAGLDPVHCAAAVFAKAGGRVRRLAIAELLCRAAEKRVSTAELPGTSSTWPAGRLTGQLAVAWPLSRRGGVGSGWMAAAATLLCGAATLSVGGIFGALMAGAGAGVGSGQSASIRAALAEAVSTSTEKGGPRAVGLGQLHATLGAVASVAALTVLLLRKRWLLCGRQARSIALVTPGLLRLALPLLVHGSLAPAVTNMPEHIGDTGPGNAPAVLTAAVPAAFQKETPQVPMNEPRARVEPPALPTVWAPGALTMPSRHGLGLPPPLPMFGPFATGQPSSLSSRVPAAGVLNLSTMPPRQQLPAVATPSESLPDEMSRNLIDVGFYVLPSLYSGAAPARL